MEKDHSSKMLVAFDLDGTLLNSNSSFAFCRFLQKKGILSRLDLYYCFQCYVLHRYGTLSLFDLHHKVFKRLFFLKKMELLIPFAQEFVDENFTSLLYHPAIEQLRFAQEKGHHIIILSASPIFLVAFFAKKFSVDEVYGTEYEVDSEGRLWNIANLVDGREKMKILLRRADELKATQTSAYTDSIIDLPLLDAVAFPIAINADRSLKRVARRRGWTII